jgi:hypothetical protein
VVKPEIIASDLMGEMTVRVKGMRVAQFRIWLSAPIWHLAAWVMGCGLEYERDEIERLAAAEKALSDAVEMIGADVCEWDNINEWHQIHVDAIDAAQARAERSSPKDSQEQG